MNYSGTVLDDEHISYENPFKLAMSNILSVSSQNQNIGDIYPSSETYNFYKKLDFGKLTYLQTLSGILEKKNYGFSSRSFYKLNDSREEKRNDTDFDGELEAIKAFSKKMVNLYSSIGQKLFNGLTNNQRAVIAETFGSIYVGERVDINRIYKEMEG